MPMFAFRSLASSSSRLMRALSWRVSTPISVSPRRSIASTSKRRVATCPRLLQRCRRPEAAGARSRERSREQKRPSASVRTRRRGPREQTRGGRSTPHLQRRTENALAPRRGAASRGPHTRKPPNERGSDADRGGPGAPCCGVDLVPALSRRPRPPEVPRHPCRRNSATGVLFLVLASCVEELLSGRSGSTERDARRRDGRRLAGNVRHRSAAPLRLGRSLLRPGRRPLRRFFGALLVGLRRERLLGPDRLFQLLLRHRGAALDARPALALE